VIHLAALALSLTISPPQAALHPLNLPLPPISPLQTEAPPEIDGASWVLYSVDRDAELLAVNPDAQRAMASVTKIMTAILVVENALLQDSDDSLFVCYQVDQAEILLGSRPISGW